MAVEIEKKALLTKDQYEACAVKLAETGAQDLGENNTNTVFYLTSSAQIKVQHALSRNTAKIAWKSGAMDGTHRREEIELAVAPDELSAAQALIERLVSGAKRYETTQLRHDYLLDGVTVSLKYSADWGYHVELDITVPDEGDTQVAMPKLAQVAHALRLRLLSEAEERKFIEARLARH